MLKGDVHPHAGGGYRDSAGNTGYVKGLRRLSIDPFGDRPMCTFEELAALGPDALDGKLLTADVAFADLPASESR